MYNSGIHSFRSCYHRDICWVSVIIIWSWKVIAQTDGHVFPFPIRGNALFYFNHAMWERALCNPVFSKEMTICWLGRIQTLHRYKYCEHVFGHSHHSHSTPSSAPAPQLSHDASYVAWVHVACSLRIYGWYLPPLTTVCCLLNCIEASIVLRVSVFW